MTCFDCKVCFGSKFTSSAEGRRFNWLIYDSMTSLFACGRFSKSRGLSASVSFLPSFPFPFPLFYSLHSSPCNSLLPNCTETLATQAIFTVTIGRFPFDQIFRFEIPGIPCDEWNSIFRFQVWRENGGLFYLCLLAFRLLDRQR